MHVCIIIKGRISKGRNREKGAIILPKKESPLLLDKM